MYAAYKGDIEDAQRGLDERADPNAVGRNGKTALITAIVANQPAVVALLLDKGAGPLLPDSDGVTPSQHAAEASEEVRKLLADALTTRAAAPIQTAAGQPSK